MGTLLYYPKFIGGDIHAASTWRLLRFTRLLRGFYFYEIKAGSVSKWLLFFGTQHCFSSLRSEDESSLPTGQSEDLDCMSCLMSCLMKTSDLPNDMSASFTASVV